MFTVFLYVEGIIGFGIVFLSVTRANTLLLPVHTWRHVVSCVRVGRPPSDMLQSVDLGDPVDIVVGCGILSFHYRFGRHIGSHDERKSTKAPFLSH